MASKWEMEGGLVVFPSGSLEEEEQVYTTFEGTAVLAILTTSTVLWF